MKTQREDELQRFEEELRREEREGRTVEKYLRDVRSFLEFVGEEQLGREHPQEWKRHLLARGYSPVTINSMLSALNRFLCFSGREEYRAKHLRIQRSLFRSREREMSREEYERLVNAAQRAGKERLELLLETICATGIRVSEVKHITVETARAGSARVHLKGKIRTILLPGKLCKKLLKYAKGQKITSGEIFLTRSGRGLSRGQIWAEMKGLCSKAKVAASKVFPHNLRHLFARVFYHTCKDVAKLSDLLGHSSVETTRLYLMSSEREHARQLERLRLVR